MKKLLTKKLNYGKIPPIGAIKAGGVRKLGVIVMLNKFGKKICAGVCALSLGLNLNVKSDAFLGQLVLATGEMASALWLGSVLKKFGFLRVQSLVDDLDDEPNDKPLMHNKVDFKAAKYVLNVNGILSICSLAYLVGDSVHRGLTAVVSRGDKKTEEPRLDYKKSNAKENK